MQCRATMMACIGNAIHPIGFLSWQEDHDRANFLLSKDWSMVPAGVTEIPMNRSDRTCRILARSLAMTAGLLVTACAHVGGTVYLSGSQPMEMRLPQGTELVYQLVSVTAETSTPAGSITYRVAEVLQTEPRTIEDRMISASDEPLLGHTRIRLTGSVYRLEMVEGTGDLEIPGLMSVSPGLASAPTALFANSEAGIVRLPRLDADEGRLVAPSHGIEVEPYYAYTEFWYVSTPDTTLTLPAGDFRCVGTTWWERPETWLTFYWSDGVGLVAYQSRRGDPRAGPADHWLEMRLVEIRLPDSLGPS